MWSAELERGHVALALVIDIDYTISCDAVLSFRDLPVWLYAESLEKHYQVGESRINSTARQDQV